MKEEARDYCGLCGKSKDQVAKLIVGVRGAVCNSCIELCVDILGQPIAQANVQPATTTERGLRDEVLYANQLLPKAGLVTMHSGNASGYLPEEDLIVIKPSGMDYDLLTADNLVPVRASTGEVLDSKFRPSVDLPHHLYLYRHLEGVRGVVHTHSNYATAFAAVGESIPLCLTAIADEFGAEIPCTPYVGNEDEEIGRAIVAHLTRAPAILLGNHGVFTWGDSPRSALKAAVMTEDVAKTVWLAKQIGTPWPIPPEEAEKWYTRYHTRYGQ